MPFKGNDVVLYKATHLVDVFSKNNLQVSRNVLVVLTKTDNDLQLKLRDVNEYSFNYSMIIDSFVFEQMKIDQCLEIDYEEFHDQIVALLKQTSSKDTLLRVETRDDACKIIFYKKSAIKSLIFLTIDLSSTNEREIIREMSANILDLKESNKNLIQQLNLSNVQMQEKDALLKVTIDKHKDLSTKFCKDISMVESILTKCLVTAEKNITNQLHQLNLRHLKLLCNLECIKKDSCTRLNLNSQLTKSLTGLKTEKENQSKTINDLYMQVQCLNSTKSNAEKNCNDLRQLLARRDREIEDLNKQITELKKDMHEATLIIAQKNKAHDEMGKDLVQANTMIVNFNNQCEYLSKEVDHLSEIVNNKEKVIKEQIKKIATISDEFEKYRSDYNQIHVEKLETDLLEARQKIEKLEKQNNEVNKLNAILTKKLASTEYEPTRHHTHWLSPK